VAAGGDGPRRAHAGSLGSLHSYGLSPAQQDWIRQQSWYAGRPMPQELLFNVGGWFVLPLGLMRRCDWPEPGLRTRAAT
jgi:hypothetical protein